MISVNTGSNLLQMNPVAEALTGRREAEAIGQPLANVFRIVNEETRAEVENPVDRVLRAGTVVGLANHTVLIAKAAVSTRLPTPGHPSAENGKITGVALVFRDQTEERAAQMALQEGEERFRGAFEHCTVGRSLTAPDGKLLRVNQALGQHAGVFHRRAATGQLC